MDSRKLGDIVLAYHNGYLYEAKCLKRRTADTGDSTEYYLHYLGYNRRWDRWIDGDQLLEINEINLAHKERLIDRSFERTREKLNRRKMSPYVRKLREEEAVELHLANSNMWKCSKCHTYLLTYSAAFNHKKCRSSSVTRSQNVTDVNDAEENIVSPKLRRIIENNETDATNEIKSSTLENITRSYDALVTTGLLTEKNKSREEKNIYTKRRVYYSNFGPDDVTSVIDPSYLQSTSREFVEVVDDDNFTACEKITIDQQTKQKPIKTTRECIKKICEHIIDLTNQCSGSSKESFINKFNFLKSKDAELEEVENNMAIEKMNKLKAERNYYLSQYILIKEELKSLRDNYIHQNKKRKQTDEILYKLKKECLKL